MNPGDVLQDRYTIVRALKSGGMGAVYEATDARLGGACAVKEMLDIFPDEEDAELIRRKFAAEAAILCQLRHPGIPSVRDHFQKGNICYIVMDLVHGANLDQELHDYQKLTGGNFPPETVVEVATQVLKILEFLHFRKPPVIHRDLKPANIIREYKTGRVMLVDFGLARTVENERSQTLIGTVGFCPLEQMQGHAEARSDLYALGATMYNLLSGQLPAGFQFPRLTDLPPGLAKVIEKATAIQAEDRFTDALQMRLALQRLDQQEPEPAPEPQQAPPTRIMPPEARPATGANWLVAATAGLALLVGGIWLGQRRAPVAAAPAPAPTVEQPGPPVVAQAEPGLSSVPVQHDYVPKRVPKPQPPEPKKPEKQPETKPDQKPEAKPPEHKPPQAAYPHAAPVRPVPAATPEPTPIPRAVAVPPPLPPEPAVEAPPPEAAVVTDGTLRWTNPPFTFNLPPGFAVRAIESGSHVRATRPGEAISEVEVTAVDPQWDFLRTARDWLDGLRREGWRITQHRPRQEGPQGWHIAVLKLRKDDRVAIEYLLLSPEQEATHKLEESPLPRRFYSVRVIATGQLREPEARALVGQACWFGELSLDALFR